MCLYERVFNVIYVYILIYILYAWGKLEKKKQCNVTGNLNYQ